MKNDLKISDVKSKLESFCAYQERCHSEVELKLKAFHISEIERGEVIVHLIQNDFLNEERFARNFARGKHRIKGWGKNRIVNELKLRNITEFNIKSALAEIEDDEYETSFERMAAIRWETITETEKLKKRKKFCDYFLRKGFDSERIYKKAIELERNDPDF